MFQPRAGLKPATATGVEAGNGMGVTIAAGGIVTVASAFLRISLLCHHRLEEDVTMGQIGLFDHENRLDYLWYRSRICVKGTRGAP